MGKRLVIAVAAVLAVTAVGTSVDAGGSKPPKPKYTTGAAGIGDPYFPTAGNGGYDVSHYDLALKYDPATGVLSGTAAIDAKATQNLSAFNLDFEGLDVARVDVDGRRATFTRVGNELTITPKHGIDTRSRFDV